MANDGGYVAVFRKVQENWMWPADGEPHSNIEAWLWLLFRAAWKPRKAPTRYGPVRLKRGEILMSYRGLSKAWGWSVKRVRSFIAQLIEDGALRHTERHRAGHIYLVVKYDDYQSPGQREGTVDDTMGAQSGHTLEPVKTVLPNLTEEAREALARLRGRMPPAAITGEIDMIVQGMRNFRATWDDVSLGICDMAAMNVEATPLNLRVWIKRAASKNSQAKGGATIREGGDGIRRLVSG